MNHAQEIAIAIQAFRNLNQVTRLVNVINVMREEGYHDDQINDLVSSVARAIFSEYKPEEY